MPSMDSNSSCYSSSGSSTSSLSSPRVPITDIVQQQQQHQPMRIPSTPTAKTSITQSHVCVTRYKTELCRPFTETGKCKYGDKCQFSHGIKELRILMRHPKYKTEYCRTFHTTGYCPYGPRCHFIHDTHEARTAIDTDDSSTLRRHSDVRTTQSPQKSTARNRMNSDYTTYSDQSHNSSKFPFSFEELNQALLSYDTGDVFQQQNQQIYPSILSPIADTFTRRTFSLSSSSNSSLIPQYI
ncbi:unnamed protein product [Adineta steineri]|uniref:C3H1-type domain-containing protein n=1 Tax=Adineta steineri TaxID=433720 RepID=A0A815FXX8_9BILA|nr:unnamed protein product [Adineta steineri]CAF1243213.1 unnamed protein product [Adineta steineri]CAF1331369.1 unnamed protein product [Adineta steineri]CAF3610050.1 unnamed protein product [Adineta steineri]CAF3874062.1 unnamed protein product [Adineta steineri]